jgi:WhiB family redox-sensing transcriptional regulator
MTGVTGERSRRVRQLLDSLGFHAPADQHWRERAACCGVDPELFFPAGAGPVVAAQVERAKRVCAGCPVRELCLADVMAWEDPALRWGVVGGLSPDERAELLERRRLEMGRARGEVA